MVSVVEAFDYVVGVDTHARTHTYCLIQTRTGAVIDSAQFPASKPGNERAISWIQRRGNNSSILAAVEGTASYGAGITAPLRRASIEVAEVRPGPKREHAHAGKSDTIDAESAAWRVLGINVESLAQPRASGDRATLRVLLAARSLIDQQRTANRNALTALLRSFELGIDVRRPAKDEQISVIAKWRISQDPGIGPLRREAKRLAKTVLEQTYLLEKNHEELARLTEQLAPGLQEIQGVGPVTGAILITAYSHHGRIRSEAAFAALGGIAPLPASSGNTTRHRLSRSGDRQLNRAIDVITRTRMSCDPTTRDYVLRRQSEGLSKREIRRCLKRYICRSLYRELKTRMA